MRYSNLPVPSTSVGLSRYLQEIKKFPMLEADEEYMLAKALVTHGDVRAADRLVTSHLRLAAKVALGYRGYGLPVGDMIQEANVGLMQAVKRFDPDLGYRLATYAMWWIRASVQEYVLRSWSLVKVGTTGVQKKLFFNLWKAKRKINALEEGDLRPENLRRIASDLNVSEQDVISMNRRMIGSDQSLNAPRSRGSDEGDAGEWQDWLEDEDADHVEAIAEKDELDMRRELLGKALEGLSERERDILQRRKLAEEPSTLRELSDGYGVSRERIRQIEVAAFKKLQAAVLALAKERGVPVPVP
ncbi:MAG: RNA polymerase sigma factor RpoH [Paracoccaceae bacterium]|nr:RNA polymerase sigma factor RpoH [Paracoccaceae bacterium]MDE2911695.1 RNA polymerase sigma factor RpoH [Paracoccaceae bacterium]